MIQWFKKHPQFYISESEKLATSGNYKELFQIRDNFFVSHGEIIVRYNGTHRHPILIYYPNSTPFSIPEIYPLSRRLDENEVKRIAMLGMSALPTDAIKQFYEYRHQNGSGLLCILETDNLDNGSEYYSINTVLDRVRLWYEGHLTGNFPPDSEEVELSAHFNNVNDKLKFFYSDEFMNPEVFEGDFLGVSMFAVGINWEEVGGAYFGARLTGFTKAGIFKDSTHPIHTFLKREGFATAVDFVTKTDLKERLIKQGGLISGFWFEIENEPKPFKDVADLIKLIGNGEQDAGIKRIANVCLDQIKILPKQIVLGVRYKNRKGISEFQLFTIQKKQGDRTIDLVSDPNDKTKSVLENYEQVQAVKCEKYNEESFFQRNGKRAVRQVLASKTINIIGAGALGGEIADCVGKAGVGVVNIIDNQPMGVQNSVRHLAGIEFMGHPKAFAVRSILENHNPFIAVVPHILNIKHLEIGLALPDESVSISSIADDNTEGYLNEQAVLFNKTVYYVRALRGGKAARIFRVIPGKDACFYCLQLHKQDGNHFIDVPLDPEYPTVRNECNNPIRPASASDLKLTASLASGLILEQLHTDSEFNHWIWSTEKIDGTPIDTAYKLYPQTIPIHNKCPYCNDSAPIKVQVKSDVLKEMQALVLAKSGIETGGVLAGYFENNTYHITHSSGPGPKAIERRDKFEKDVTFCQDFIDTLYRQYGDKAIYIGEWHSHPNSNNRPSNVDLHSLNNIATEKNYLITKPIMIIFSSEGEPACTVHPADSRYYNVQLEIVENE